MSDSPSYERLSARVERLNTQVAELERVVAEQADEIAERKRWLGADSSNSSRPPSADAPWNKQPAKPGSSRGHLGRKPGKQPGAASRSRPLSDDPSEVKEITPDRCRRCDAWLAGAVEHDRERRQILDVGQAPPPRIIEYRRISKRCSCGGEVTTPDWRAGDPGHAEIIAAPGSPVPIGPETIARAALLTRAHHLPVDRARDLLEALTAIDVSTGFLAVIRGRAARRLEKTFPPAPRELPLGAPVLHAEQTPAAPRVGCPGCHVARTEYLTLMHVGDRSAATINAGRCRPRSAERWCATVTPDTPTCRPCTPGAAPIMPTSGLCR